MKKHLLITGASGFIGKNLTKYLSKKYCLFTPTHEQLDLLDGDKVLRFFKKHRIDTVIHCAVIGGNRTDQFVKGMFYDNVRMFFNLVRYRNYYKRLINTSSGAVYDKMFPIVKIKEEDFGRHIPNDEYGLYKYICSDFIRQTDNMIDLRVFGIFGEGEDYRHRFISNALCRHIKGLPITIKQNVYFDYVDITDFVVIIEYFIRHKAKYKEYNIGTGNKISLISIARTIVKLYGNDDYPIIVSKKGLAHEYSCNTDRLFSEISGFKTTPFVSSLERLATWYQHQEARIDKKQL